MAADRTARKQRKVRIPAGLKKKKSGKREAKPGEIPCGVNSCNDFSDKHLGGRSLSQDDAIDVWGEGGITVRKSRVRICKPCYRIWKRENKDKEQHY
tara:strand:- start:750 stop:1040 length:291 start_codon:yes stop_codon:yes gene_type:complete